VRYAEILSAEGTGCISLSVLVFHSVFFNQLGENFHFLLGVYKSERDFHFLQKTNSLTAQDYHAQPDWILSTNY